jgi:N-acetyl-beta-hexosaminidase
MPGHAGAFLLAYPELAPKKDGDKINNSDNNNNNNNNKLINSVNKITGVNSTTSAALTTVTPSTGAPIAPPSLPTAWGVLPWVLDATSTSVYEWIEKFVDEMVTLFPDSYYHIGGDEVCGDVSNVVFVFSLFFTQVVR